MSSSRNFTEHQPIVLLGKYVDYIHGDLWWAGGGEEIETRAENIKLS